MATELTIHAVHEGGMRFTAGNGTHTVNVDYPLEAGDVGTGLRSLELLLASLATCGGNTLALSRAHGAAVHRARGRGTGVAPRGASDGAHRHRPGVRRARRRRRQGGVEKAITVAETQLAPVWIMIKAGTPITTSVRLDDD